MGHRWDGAIRGRPLLQDPTVGLRGKESTVRAQPGIPCPQGEKMVPRAIAFGATAAAHSEIGLALRGGASCA